MDIAPFIDTLAREALQEVQLRRFQASLGTILESNAFYRAKFRQAGLRSANDVGSAEDFYRLPFTTKQELSDDQSAHPPYGTNLTFERSRYRRIHQTSGTTGRPLLWLDTEESWAWWARCWATVYRAAGIGPDDRIFFAFSFGPFIGFWSAYEGARLVGAMSIPGGGMSSRQRASAVLTHDATVLVCTPSYALHLAEVASEGGLDVAGSSVRATIQAGEPGASLPAVKRRIEQQWGARCYDHAGSTEAGAWGFECSAQAGLHLNEGEFICEVVDPQSGAPASEGELVLTNLGRTGMPVIRYRTGDRVKLKTEPCQCGRTFHRLENGVIGRVDGVLLVRGVSVYPSAVEDVVRRFPEVGEFAVDISREHELDEMTIRAEIAVTGADRIAAAIAEEIREALGLRPRVEIVPSGSLPRFDLGGKRFSDHRSPARKRR